MHLFWTLAFSSFAIAANLAESSCSTTVSVTETTTSTKIATSTASAGKGFLSETSPLAVDSHIIFALQHQQQSRLQPMTLGLLHKSQMLSRMLKRMKFPQSLS